MAAASASSASSMDRRALGGSMPGGVRLSWSRPTVALWTSGSSCSRVPFRLGLASTSMSALAFFGFEDASYCRANCSCSLRLDFGSHAPTVGSSSSRSAGTPPAAFGFRRLGSFSKSSPTACWLKSAPLPAARALLLALAASAARARSRRSRRPNLRGASAAPEPPEPSAGGASGASAPTSGAAASVFFSAFFAATAAFFIFGRSLVSSGASFSCNSLSHTSCETTGCVLTEPPSARSST
mmetsp:Transcript_86558/g.242302  ORF Transcript_86558/g.242302 Transcript_86558/m.242302 type:complete len:240 (-) Transcript_86558:925-1644(-)